MAERILVTSGAAPSCSRDIRERLGERLKAYYEWALHSPLPERLAELVERLVQQVEEHTVEPDKSKPAGA